jgi:hypothetical protein
MSVAVFDFDWTILDEDSDAWVFKNLNSKLLEKVLYQNTSRFFRLIYFL